MASPLLLPLAITAGSTAAGLLTRKKGGGFNQEALDMALSRRKGEIETFSAALGKARANYIAQLNNLNNLTFQRFAPQAEAQFAGRGLQVTGGAYQSALAKKSAELSAQGMVTAAEAERQDLASAEQLRAQAYNSWLTGTAQGMSGPVDNTTSQLWGQMAGAGLTMLGDTYRSQRAAATSQSPDMSMYNSVMRRKPREFTLGLGANTQGLYR